MAQSDTKFVDPGPRPAQRATRKEARQARFLQEFLVYGQKTEAARSAGVPIRTMHRWFKSDAGFYREADGIFSEVHKVALLAELMAAIERLRVRAGSG